MCNSSYMPDRMNSHAGCLSSKSNFGFISRKNNYNFRCRSAFIRANDHQLIIMVRPHPCQKVEAAVNTDFLIDVM